MPPDVQALSPYAYQNAFSLPLAFLAAAYSAFAAGKALPGPGAAEEFNDFAFALPGGAKESYLDLVQPLVAAELSDLAPLWEEP